MMAVLFSSAQMPVHQHRQIRWCDQFPSFGAVSAVCIADVDHGAKSVGEIDFLGSQSDYLPARRQAQVEEKECEKCKNPVRVLNSGSDLSYGRAKSVCLAVVEHLRQRRFSCCRMDDFSWAGGEHIGVDQENQEHAHSRDGQFLSLASESLVLEPDLEALDIRALNGS